MEGKHTHIRVDPNLSLNASRARKIVLSLDKTFPKPVKQDTILEGSMIYLLIASFL